MLKIAYNIFIEIEKGKKEMTTVGTKNYTGGIRNDRVFFEHNEYGEDNSVTMYIKDDNVVYDYDHCWEIPAEIQTFMIRKGYNLTEVV